MCIRLLDVLQEVTGLICSSCCSVATEDIAVSPASRMGIVQVEKLLDEVEAADGGGAAGSGGSGEADLDARVRLYERVASEVPIAASRSPWNAFDGTLGCAGRLVVRQQERLLQAACMLQPAVLMSAQGQPSCHLPSSNSNQRPRCPCNLHPCRSAACSSMRREAPTCPSLRRCSRAWQLPPLHCR